MCMVGEKVAVFFENRQNVAAIDVARVKKLLCSLELGVEDTLIFSSYLN